MARSPLEFRQVESDDDLDANTIKIEPLGNLDGPPGDKPEQEEWSQDAQPRDPYQEDAQPQNSCQADGKPQDSCDEDGKPQDSYDEDGKPQDPYPEDAQPHRTPTRTLAPMIFRRR